MEERHPRAPAHSWRYSAAAYTFWRCRKQHRGFFGWQPLGKYRSKGPLDAMRRRLVQVLHDLVDHLLHGPLPGIAKNQLHAFRISQDIRQIVGGRRRNVRQSCGNFPSSLTTMANGRVAGSICAWRRRTRWAVRGHATTRSSRTDFLLATTQGAQTDRLNSDGLRSAHGPGALSQT